MGLRSENFPTTFLRIHQMDREPIPGLLSIILRETASIGYSFLNDSNPICIPSRHKPIGKDETHMVIKDTLSDSGHGEQKCLDQQGGSPDSDGTATEKLTHRYEEGLAPNGTRLFFLLTPSRNFLAPMCHREFRPGGRISNCWLVGSPAQCSDSSDIWELSGQPIQAGCQCSGWRQSGCPC